MIGILLVKTSSISRRTPKQAGNKPLKPDAPDFLSVQVTIALDALLIPMKGAYYFNFNL